MPELPQTSNMVVLSLSPEQVQDTHAFYQDFSISTTEAAEILKGEGENKISV